MDNDTIEIIHCECGHSEFDVTSGVKPWDEHILTCRKCGKQYRLMSLFINDKNISSQPKNMEGK